MADYPDMRDLARHATEDYSRVESIEAFRPPYPGQGTPNWWAMRLRYEQLLMAKIRKSRAGTQIKSKPINEAELDAAKWAALGNEQANADYQGFVPSAHQVIDRQRQKGWLDGQIEAATKAMRK